MPPDHLVLITESRAVGVDTAGELGRILAEKPEVVVTRKARIGRQPVEIRAILARTLEKNYRPALRTSSGYSQSVDDLTVWQRKDLPPPAVR